MISSSNRNSDANNNTFDIEGDRVGMINSNNNHDELMMMGGAGAGTGAGAGAGAGIWGEIGIMMICGSLVYYHCACRDSSLLTLISDVFIVLLSSLAILGLLFRHISISIPVDPLDWQISQDSASRLFASLANTVGAAESVLRVAATAHDKRLFCKVVFSLYFLSVLGRLFSGVTVAYAGLCFYCLYLLAENSHLIGATSMQSLGKRDSTVPAEDNI